MLYSPRVLVNYCTKEILRAHRLLKIRGIVAIDTTTAGTVQGTANNSEEKKN